MRTVIVIGFGLAALLRTAPTVSAADCGVVDSLLAQGFSVVEVARQTGIPSSTVAACQRAQRNSIRIPSGNRRFGPAGPPPVGAAGPAPLNPAGPPPVGAAGPPPLNPAGPPPGE